MNEKNYAVENAFYQACAELLCVPHEYRPFPPRKRNRWTNREAGNGRFPGHGCVRMFGEGCIHVMLSKPRLNRYFTSCDAALSAIRDALHIEPPS